MRRAASSVILRINQSKKQVLSELGSANTLTPGSIETKILKSSLLLSNSTLSKSNLRTLIMISLIFTLPDGDLLISLDDQTDSIGD